MSDIVERVRAMVVEAIMEDLAVMVDRMLEEALTPELEVIARQLVTCELQRLRVAMGTADPVFPEFQPDVHVVGDDAHECELEPTHSPLMTEVRGWADEIARGWRDLGLDGAFTPHVLSTACRAARLLRERPDVVVTDAALMSRVGVGTIGGISKYEWRDLVCPILTSLPDITSRRADSGPSWVCSTVGGGR